MQRFTERRMRPGFGAGISIPSQVRTMEYVDRWTKHGKLYVDCAVEVLELHVWGLRDGVKIAVEGYVEEGKVIKMFHTFKHSEREIVRGSIIKESGIADAAMEVMGRNQKQTDAAQQPAVPLEEPGTARAMVNAQKDSNVGAQSVNRTDLKQLTDANGGDVVFRPSSPVVLPSSDVKIDFERRTRTKYGGFTLVTSVAHVWFNVFFEGRGPEQQSQADERGVFEIQWDAMDGIKGSSRKGTRAFDKLAVVWKVADVGNKFDMVVHEPGVGEEVPHMKPADWRGHAANDEQSEDFEKKLGLRAATVESAAVSRASSMLDDGKSDANSESADVPDELESVRQHVPDGKQSESIGGRPDK